MNDVGVLNPKPVVVLDRRELNLRLGVIIEVLVQWQGGSVEDAKLWVRCFKRR